MYTYVYIRKYVCKWVGGWVYACVCTPIIRCSPDHSGMVPRRGERCVRAGGLGLTLYISIVLYIDIHIRKPIYVCIYMYRKIDA